MKNKTNLRFLLALGGQKVLMLNEAEGQHIYTDKTPCSANVSLHNIYKAFSDHASQLNKADLCGAKR